MALDFKRFVALGMPRLSLVSPVLLIVAIGSTVWAAASIKTASQAVANRTALNGQSNTISIKSNPASTEDTLASARRLAALSPHVVIAVKGSTLTVSVATVNGFTDWLNAMTAVQSTLAGYQWEVDEICLAACGDGNAAKASIRATRPYLAFKN